MQFNEYESNRLYRHSNNTLGPTKPNYQVDGIRRYNFGPGYGYDQNMIARTHHGYQCEYRSHFFDQYGRIVNKPPPDDRRYRPDLTAAVVVVPFPVPAPRPPRKHRGRSGSRKKNKEKIMCGFNGKPNHYYPPTSSFGNGMTALKTLSHNDNSKVPYQKFSCDSISLEGGENGGGGRDKYTDDDDDDEGSSDSEYSDDSSDSSDSESDYDDGPPRPTMY